MSTHNLNLKSSLRNSVNKTYRGRGKSINNLWLVYSLKTDRDWLIPSDRQLIHWLYYLETNSNVISFDLAPEPVLSSDDLEVKATELDAIVVLKDGSIEWHEVKAGTSPIDPKHLSQMQAQVKAASNARVKYLRFNDVHLKSKVEISLRWKKAIAFAASIRNQEHTLCRVVLVNRIKNQHSGNIKNLLISLDEFEASIILGLLVRLAIENVISLDLTEESFGYQTKWKYHG